MNVNNMRPPKEEIRAFARDGYGNASWVDDEDFSRDFDDIYVTRKMVSRFLTSDDINEKLIINKLVMTLNAFGTKKTNALFRMICTDVQFSVIKAILMFVHQYDFSIGEDVYPNRIMVDILKDIQTRYNLEHIK